MGNIYGYIRVSSTDQNEAQAHTVCKLSRALGCSMEDLLENPMR